MIKRFIPYCHAKSIYEIDMSFYARHKIKYIFTDLDNTLDSVKSATPTKTAIDFLQKLKDNGIELIIISNNRGKRVSLYSSSLGVKYLHSSFKPFARRIKKYIIENNFDKNAIIFIGDQLVTDVSAGNGAGLKTVFTEKLVPEDQWTTRFNRFFEKFIKRKLIKKNLLVDWRER